MAKGMSLHIGLNSVDPAHYAGWDGPLVACEADANDMAAIAKKMGYKKTALLTTAKATRAAVRAAVQKAAKSLRSGDIFFVSYSGHGGRVPDKNQDESDNTDETWCLYDGEMVDDELAVLWSKFRKGVRVLVLSDSCHSGTVTRAPDEEAPVDPSGVRRRFMPRDIAIKTYRANKELYDSIAAKLPKKLPKIGACVRLISGCQDNQYSNDGDFNGLFTATLLQVWSDGGFTGNYSEFHKQILQLMPRYQSPNHDTIGARDRKFDAQRPFFVA